MARDDRKKTAPSLSDTADISLIGPVDEAMACKLRDALWDADDNRFIDYRLGFGPIILGHAHPEVTRKDG